MTLPISPTEAHEEKGGTPQSTRRRSGHVLLSMKSYMESYGTCSAVNEKLHREVADGLHSQCSVTVDDATQLGWELSPQHTAPELGSPLQLWLLMAGLELLCLHSPALPAMRCYSMTRPKPQVESPVLPQRGRRLCSCVSYWPSFALGGALHTQEWGRESWIQCEVGVRSSCQDQACLIAIATAVLLQHASTLQRRQLGSATRPGQCMASMATAGTFNDWFKAQPGLHI